MLVRDHIQKPQCNFAVTILDHRSSGQASKKYNVSPLPAFHLTIVAANHSEPFRTLFSARESHILTVSQYMCPDMHTDDFCSLDYESPTPQTSLSAVCYPLHLDRGHHPLLPDASQDPTVFRFTIQSSRLFSPTADLTSRTGDQFPRGSHHHKRLALSNTELSFDRLTERPGEVGS